MLSLLGAQFTPWLGNLNPTNLLVQLGGKRIDLEAKQEERWETMFQSEIVAVEVRSVERFWIHLK